MQAIEAKQPSQEYFVDLSDLAAIMATLADLLQTSRQVIDSSQVNLDRWTDQKHVVLSQLTMHDANYADQVLNLVYFIENRSKRDIQQILNVANQYNRFENDSQQYFKDSHRFQQTIQDSKDDQYLKKDNFQHSSYSEDKLLFLYNIENAKYISPIYYESQKLHIVRSLQLMRQQLDAYMHFKNYSSKGKIGRLRFSQQKELYQIFINKIFVEQFSGNSRQKQAQGVDAQAEVARGSRYHPHYSRLIMSLMWEAFQQFKPDKKDKAFNYDDITYYIFFRIELYERGLAIFDSSDCDYQLHQAVFQRDLPLLSRLLRGECPGVFFQNKNKLDPCGNTPLTLAVKLGYDDVIKILSDLLTCPKMKSLPFSQCALEVAQNQQDRVKMLNILLESIQKIKQSQLDLNKEVIFATLESMIDFQVDLHFSCKSSIIPFVGHVTPSDTYKIYKQGSDIRLDMTLIEFKWLNCVRGNISILYKGSKSQKEDQGELLVVDHQAKTVNNLFEVNEGTQKTIDKKRDELVKAEKTEKKYKTDNFILKAEQKSKNQPYKKLIEGYLSQKYTVKSKYTMTKKKFKQNILDKKNMQGFKSFKDYIKYMKLDMFSLANSGIAQQNQMSSTSVFKGSSNHNQKDQMVLTSVRQLSSIRDEQSKYQRVQSKKNSIRLDTDVQANTRNQGHQFTYFKNQNTADEAFSGGTPHGLNLMLTASSNQKQNDLASSNTLISQKTTKKSLNATLWLSNQYPISLKQFYPLLNVLSFGSKQIRKLNKHLQKYQLPYDFFPLKAELPIFTTTEATFSFINLKLLDARTNRSEIESIFQVDKRVTEQRRQLLVKQYQQQMASNENSQIDLVQQPNQKVLDEIYNQFKTDEEIEGSDYVMCQDNYDEQLNQDNLLLSKNSAANSLLIDYSVVYDQMGRLSSNKNPHDQIPVIHSGPKNVNKRNVSQENLLMQQSQVVDFNSVGKESEVEDCELNEKQNVQPNDDDDEVKQGMVFKTTHNFVTVKTMDQINQRVDTVSSDVTDNQQQLSRSKHGIHKQKPLSDLFKDNNKHQVHLLKKGKNQQSQQSVSKMQTFMNSQISLNQSKNRSAQSSQVNVSNNMNNLSLDHGENIKDSRIQDDRPMINKTIEKRQLGLYHFAPSNYVISKKDENQFENEVYMSRAIGQDIFTLKRPFTAITAHSTQNKQKIESSAQYSSLLNKEIKEKSEQQTRNDVQPARTLPLYSVTYQAVTANTNQKHHITQKQNQQKQSSPVLNQPASLNQISISHCGVASKGGPAVKISQKIAVDTNLSTPMSQSTIYQPQQFGSTHNKHQLSVDMMNQQQSSTNITSHYDDLVSQTQLKNVQNAGHFQEIAQSNNLSNNGKYDYILTKREVSQSPLHLHSSKFVGANNLGVQQKSLIPLNNNSGSSVYASTYSKNSTSRKKGNNLVKGTLNIQSRKLAGNGKPKNAITQQYLNTIESEEGVQLTTDGNLKNQDFNQQLPHSNKLRSIIEGDSVLGQDQNFIESNPSFLLSKGHQSQMQEQLLLHNHQVNTSTQNQNQVIFALSGQKSHQNTNQMSSVNFASEKSSFVSHANKPKGVSTISDINNQVGNSFNNTVVETIQKGQIHKNATIGNIADLKASKLYDEKRKESEGAYSGYLNQTRKIKSNTIHVSGCNPQATAVQKSSATGQPSDRTREPSEPAKQTKKYSDYIIQLLPLSIQGQRRNASEEKSLNQQSVDKHSRQSKQSLHDSQEQQKSSKLSYTGSGGIFSKIFGNYSNTLNNNHISNRNTQVKAVESQQEQISNSRTIPITSHGQPSNGSKLKDSMRYSSQDLQGAEQQSKQSERSKHMSRASSTSLQKHIVGGNNRIPQKDSLPGNTYNIQSSAKKTFHNIPYQEQLPSQWMQNQEINPKIKENMKQRLHSASSINHTISGVGFTQEAVLQDDNALAQAYELYMSKKQVNPQGIIQAVGQQNISKGSVIRAHQQNSIYDKDQSFTRQFPHSQMQYSSSANQEQASKQLKSEQIDLKLLQGQPVRVKLKQNKKQSNENVTLPKSSHLVKYESLIHQESQHQLPRENQIQYSKRNKS